MTTIESMYPNTIICRDKLRKYLHFHHERDEFIKGLSKMRHCDWVIHKKLSDERNKVKYLYLARGNGKWAVVDKYIDFMINGDDMVRRIEKAKQVIKKEPVLDHDIVPFDSWNGLRPLNACYGHTYNFEPKIRTDAYLYSNDYARQLLLYNQLMFGGVSKDTFDEDWDYISI